jgi:eukaryotic-like serine/threonine-protein kinase
MTDRSTPDLPEDPRLAGLRAGLAGRYEIVRPVGEGGMALVLLARDLQHHRLVALKVLHPDVTPALGGERFHREIRLIAGLQHPHIVSVYDSGETAGHLWYAMPYIEGESLRRRLGREQQLALPEAVRITLEAARAIAVAHRAGVVHRDLKPENLLLTPGGEVYVVDFGVARSAASDSLTRTGLAVGTPLYMSPEQAAGSAGLDPRSDVYSLGCLLYEMLAGEPPFTAKTPQAISAKHLHAPVPDVRIIRETVTAALQRVLETCLAKSPADRYPDAGALADALETALSTPGTMFGSKLRRYAAILAGVLAISFGGYRAIRPVQHEGQVATPKTHAVPIVAVLYFEHPASDTSLAPIAEDLTEELIRELSGVGNAFRVVSKFGVRSVRNRDVPVDSMRKTLNADYWLSGEVRRGDGQLIVRASLIDPQSNTVIDSLGARAAASDPHQLASAAAVAVATAFRQKLKLEVHLADSTPGSSNRLANSLEYEAERSRRSAEYLRSLPDAKAIPAALEALARADSLLERSAREDSTWLKPWVVRGWVAMDRAMMASGPEQVTLIERAMVFADEAVRRAPNDAAALELRGTAGFKLVNAENSDDPDSEKLVKAEGDLRDAVGRDSLRASAWATLSYLLWVRGKPEQAAIAARAALEADAFLADAQDVKSMLFYADLTQGNFAEAREWCHRARLEYPGDYQAVQCDLTLLRHDRTGRPDPDSAWRLVAILDSLDPPEKAVAAGHPYTPIYRRVVAASLDARAGHVARARAELLRARKAVAGDSTMQLDLAPDEACLLLDLGQRDEAIRILRAMLEVRRNLEPLLTRDPTFRGLPISVTGPSTGPT